MSRLPDPARLATDIGGNIPRPPLQQKHVELWPEGWYADRQLSYGLCMNYWSDWSYVEKLDRDMLAYVLPTSLLAWQSLLVASLSEQQYYIAGPELGDMSNCVAEMHTALATRPSVLPELLGADAEAAVVRFASASLEAALMRRTRLTPPNLRWVRYWVSLSSGLPGLSAEGWRSAMAPETAGGAVALFSWVMRLAYPPMHNPLYPDTYDSTEPWHRDAGVWTPEAIAMLRQQASYEAVLPSLTVAASRLDPSDRDLADLLVADMPVQRKEYELRLAEVSDNLGRQDWDEYWKFQYLA